jgi:hypothetical protein
MKFDGAVFQVHTFKIIIIRSCEVFLGGDFAAERVNLPEDGGNSVDGEVG